MASYHCTVKVGSRGKAASHAEYISRNGKYSGSARYEDLEATAHGNMPRWADHNPAHFWNAADEHERANGAAYREIEVALPRELDPAQRRALVEDFIAQEIGDKHAFQWAIHTPKAALEKGEQPHAHIMYSERTVDGIERDPGQYFKRYNGKSPEKGGCRKDSAGTEERLQSTRQRWADVQNKHLERHGHETRVDHRSLKAQGIDRQPEKHIGASRVKDMQTQDVAALLTRRAAEKELEQAQKQVVQIGLKDEILRERWEAAQRMSESKREAERAKQQERQKQDDQKILAAIMIAAQSIKNEKQREEVVKNYAKSHGITVPEKKDEQSAIEAEKAREKIQRSERLKLDRFNKKPAPEKAESPGEIKKKFLTEMGIEVAKIEAKAKSLDEKIAEKIIAQKAIIAKKTKEKPTKNFFEREKTFQQRVAKHTAEWRKMDRRLSVLQSRETRVSHYVKIWKTYPSHASRADPLGYTYSGRGGDLAAQKVANRDPNLVRKMFAVEQAEKAAAKQAELDRQENQRQRALEQKQRQAKPQEKENGSERDDSPSMS